MFKKIDHVGVVVSNLDEARDFFLQFGFEVVKRGMLNGEWIDKILKLSNVKAEYIALAIPGTQTNLELLKFYNPQGDKDKNISMANQMGFRHIAIEVKNIEKIVENLKNKGVKFFSDIQIYNEKKKLCYFLGPEGIILELAEYT